MPIDADYACSAPRIVGVHAAPAARLAPRWPEPVPTRPQQPAPARRGRGRRDVDGVAVAHGRPGRGRAIGREVGPRGRSRPARLRRGRRGAAATSSDPPETPIRQRRRSAAASSSSGRCTASGARSPSWRRRSNVATPQSAVDVLRGGGDVVRWIEADVGDGHLPAALEPVRDGVVEAGRRVVDAARAGDARAALAGLRAVRILCAHRLGPYGVAAWTGRVERWLETSIDGYGDGGPWYVGCPLLVTQNDHALRLYNGDTGVVVDAGGGRAVAAFERGPELLEVSPRRLAAVDTVHAMTVHKARAPSSTPSRHPARRRLAHPHPRAALHGRHPGTDAAHRGRAGGQRQSGRRAPHRQGDRPS